MITKPYVLKDFRHSCARFVLLTQIFYGVIVPAWGSDTAVPSSEADASIINNTSVSAYTIPADNPIGGILLSKHHPLLLFADFSRVSDSVTGIYQNSNFQPIWFTSNPSEKNLADLLSILNNASIDGLNPANYDIDRLKDMMSNKNPDINTAACYDVALTVSLVRYLHDLRQGQVEPRDIQYPVQFPPKQPLNIVSLLKQHRSSQTLTELASLFEPKAPQYQRLKQIFNQLQPLLNQANLDELKLRKVLRPGERHPQIPMLRQHLRAIGALDSIKADDKTYDNDLVAAVKTVQQQHGLKANGVIDPATAALVNQSPREKLVQIQLAMERARWIPDISDGPVIVVNIPAFELFAFNSNDDPNPLNMKVVVGKWPDNKTPELLEDMKYLEFMPYWNIPKKIFEKEIRPKIANNNSYLASHEIELIRHQNSDEQGGNSYIRARQRPGKKNPLGRVKFVFPNIADVYLHDTPSHAAFNRQRRDLSHGCVRVSEPEQLAEFVLGNQEGWNKETIRQAMSAPKTRHVTLKRAVPVLFYYATTFVNHENKLRFYPDVYGQDELLKKALNKIQAPSNPNLTLNKTTELAANP